MVEACNMSRCSKDVSWQFLSCGAWYEYSTELKDKLELAFQNGRRFFTLHSEWGTRRTVNFELMVETVYRGEKETQKRMRRTPKNFACNLDILGIDSFERVARNSGFEGFKSTADAVTHKRRCRDIDYAWQSGTPSPPVRSPSLPAISRSPAATAAAATTDGHVSPLRVKCRGGTPTRLRAIDVNGAHGTLCFV